MGDTGTSLGSRFTALQAERNRDWEPALLQANAGQRRRLVADAAGRRLVTEGDAVASFALQRHDGSLVALDHLLHDGPLVLVFFRFAGCPACNIALSYYQEALAPELARRGVTLVAVSPQIPGRVQEIAVRHALSFPVLTDPGNTLAHRFGIVFEPDEAEKAAALAKGSFIGDATGTGTWELPMPGVVLIDRDRIVRYANISPDWLVRCEADAVLAATDRVGVSKAA